MNGSELVEKIVSDSGLNKTDVKSVVESVLNAIAAAAVADEEVNLPGFGKFKIKRTPEREGRNPATGEAIKIAASRKLVFQPAKALKDRLNT